LRYSRTGLVRVDGTSYIGHRKTKCRKTSYLAPAKLVKMSREVLRFQIRIRVDSTDSLTLAELADLVEPKERIVELFSDRVRFEDFDFDDLTLYFARSMAGQRNGSTKWSRSTTTSSKRDRQR